MAQTRMFRDRVVSMEQTLEGGEKNLDFLKGLCREAFPEFEYRDHGLDHEKDMFVMTLVAEDGRTKTISWTRMVLFDAERIPALLENPISPLRSRILAFLQARTARSEIVVTFRHLEDGWVDTPEPRKEKRRGRRGGRDGRAKQGQPGRGPGGGPQPAPGQGGGGRPGGGRRDGAAASKGRPGGRPERAPGERAGTERAAGERARGERGSGAGTSGPGPREPRPAVRPAVPGGGSQTGMPPVGAGPAPAGEVGGEGRPGGRRRRFRRRRRGRGGAGGPGAPGGGGSGPAGAPSGGGQAP